MYNFQRKSFQLKGNIASFDIWYIGELKWSFENDQKKESRILDSEIKMEQNYIECISNEPFDCIRKIFHIIFGRKNSVFLHKQSQAVVPGRTHTDIHTHYVATLNWKLCEFRPTLGFQLAAKKMHRYEPQLEHTRCLVICWTKKINFITFACHSKFVTLTWPFWAPVHSHYNIYDIFLWNSKASSGGSSVWSEKPSLCVWQWRIVRCHCPERHRMQTQQMKGTENSWKFSVSVF